MTTDISPITSKLGLTYGALLLRIWLAVRAIQTGLEKYSGAVASTDLVKVEGVANTYGLTAASSTKAYAISNYQGVPSGLMKKFQEEPFVLKAALPIYDRVLGPALLILGVMILLGIASRTSLFLLGIIYISLTWGLILLKQDEGVSWLGVHMILVALALMLADHNRFTILKKW